MANVNYVLSLTALVILLTSCSHSNCKNVQSRPSESEVAAVPPSDGHAGTRLPNSQPEAIKIYVPSGEKQCGMGAGLPLEKFKKKLEKVKVRVHSAKTQDDGLMHMQVCGSPTGQIHVFEIDRGHLKKAQGLGFQELKSP